MGLFDAYSSKKPTDPVASPEAAAPPALHASPLAKAIEAGPRDEEGSSEKPGFLKSHFGNPEAGEVYGVGNDYETEAQMRTDEKASANQAIWYTGAFILFLLVAYLFFGR